MAQKLGDSLRLLPRSHFAIISNLAPPPTVEAASSTFRRQASFHSRQCLLTATSGAAVNLLELAMNSDFAFDAAAMLSLFGLVAWCKKLVVQLLLGCIINV